MLYQHETIDVVPGKLDEYVAALERLWLPVAQKRNLRLLGFWQTIGSTGRWPEAIAIWEIDDWTHFAKLRESQYEDAHRDKGLAEWIAKAWQWRSGGFDRILLPGPGCPTLKELLAKNVRGRIFLHEIVQCVPGKVPEYVASVIKDYYPIAERRGLQPVGTYRVAMRNAEAVNVWAVKDWQAWAHLQESQPRDAEFQRWMREQMSLRTDWESKLMTPVSWCPLAG
jgi:hypothetical protein